MVRVSGSLSSYLNNNPLGQHTKRHKSIKQRIIKIKSFSIVSLFSLLGNKYIDEISIVSIQFFS